jgi:hypothetical protein
MAHLGFREIAETCRAVRFSERSGRAYWSANACALQQTLFFPVHPFAAGRGDADIDRRTCLDLLLKHAEPAKLNVA